MTKNDYGRRALMHWVRAFFESRFGNPDTDPTYFNEWVSRFTSLECDSLIPHQMDIGSRQAWGRVTGLKYAVIKYNYDIDPVFEVVDLETGMTTSQTAFIKEKIEDGTIKVKPTCHFCDELSEGEMRVSGEIEPVCEDCFEGFTGHTFQSIKDEIAERELKPSIDPTIPDNS